MTLLASYRERLETLVLLRLLASGKPAVKSVLNKDLSRYFTDQLAVPEAEWPELLDQALQTLRARSAVTPEPLRVTEMGRVEIAGSLNVELPTSQSRWPVLRNRYLVAHALGIRPQTSQEWNRLSTADGLRAAVLVKHFGLPTGPVPTTARALHALAWLQLAQHQPAALPKQAIPKEKDFTRDAVLRAVFFAGRPCKDLVSGLAAQVTHAATTSPDRLRDAVIAAWVDNKDTRASAVIEFDLSVFASRVVEFARDTRTGRYGDHKVFISHVWDRFRQDRAALGMSRDEFNQRLVEANRAELLTLTRADLVSAMSPEDVQQSEIRLPHASFHFIRTDMQAI